VKRLVVTGAGGFIGRHLLESEILKRIPVRAILGPDDAPLSSAEKSPRMNCHRCDIRQEGELGDAFRGADTVIHLAGPASVSASFQNPDEYLSTHVIGTRVVMATALRQGVRRFVHISSAEVYGRARTHPVPESAPLHPRSPYGAAKAGSEMVCTAAVRAILTTDSPATVVILRPFLVYGPGMRRTGVVHSVLRQSRWEDSVELMDPSPVRDFCFVGDVVDAIVMACQGAFDRPISIFNVGTGTGVSIGALAEAALAAAGREAPVVVAPERDRPRAADVQRLVADTSRATALLGWSARVPLAEGLKATLQRDSSLRESTHA
jgi:nucleoside-diphosphate-sugar epimerase